MLRLVLVAYLATVLVMMLFESLLVYPAPPVELGDWSPAGLDHEEVWFDAADGTRLYGWFLPHARPKHALLYCHGNGEHVAMNAELMAHLRDALGASVMIFDYRGYGRSDGRPDEAGCIADGLAAQQWLAQRTGLRTGDVVLMGRSLGGGVVVALAAESGARALVLENTFGRLVDIAAYHMPWLPVRLLMRNRYDSLARIAHYRGPVFQSHAVEDTICPIRFGRELFDAAPSAEKQFVELADSNHNDPPPADYWKQLAAFLDRLPPVAPL